MHFGGTAHVIVTLLFPAQASPLPPFLPREASALLVSRVTAPVGPKAVISCVASLKPGTSCKGGFKPREVPVSVLNSIVRPDPLLATTRSQAKTRIPCNESNRPKKAQGRALPMDLFPDPHRPRRNKHSGVLGHESRLRLPSLVQVPKLGHRSPALPPVSGLLCGGLVVVTEKPGARWRGPGFRGTDTSSTDACAQVPPPDH